MKETANQQDIIIAGVGGQGLLTIAAVIGAAALHKGYYVKQSEVHGMAQRGGAVVSHLRLSLAPIASDLVPPGSAHLILATEPMEALRYLPFIRPDGWLVTNRHPVRNVANYPPLEAVLAEVERWPNRVVVDAEQLAKDAGSRRAVNLVMLGAATDYLVVSHHDLVAQVEKFFARKGAEIVQANLAAFEAGHLAAARQKK